MNAKINLFGHTYNVTVHKDSYRIDDNMCVYLTETLSGEHFADLSVNLPASSELMGNEFYAKHWSENEGIVEQLVDQGIIEKVSAHPTSSGFVYGICAYRLVE
jgi:hypothetical protein